MKQVRILRNGEEILVARHANTFWTRMKGLLGSPEPPEGEGLLIEPCNSIHMFGMPYPIDALFLNREDEVVAILENFQPWKASRIFFNATRVLETRAGEAARLGISVGDRLEVTP